MNVVTGVASTLEESKAELAAVLSSATFVRTPRMSRLLSYLATKYFLGQAKDIKEYNIAVDLLGRPATFDPAQDAIARVEVHRLRKKLREYYETEGADRPIRILIPTGTYVPGFVSAEKSTAVIPPAVLSSPEPQPVTEVVTPAPQPATGAFSLARWRTRGLAAVLTVLILLAVLYGFHRIRPGILGADVKAMSHATSDGVRPAQYLAPPAGQEVRIRAGRAASYTDRLGRVWGGDRFFSGGSEYQSTAKLLARTREPELFLEGRTGSFAYDIPLKPGVYELHLYFAETMLGPGKPAGGGENSRVFHVAANGRRILSEFDVLADAEGPDTADVRVFKDIVPAADGMLHLRFLSSIGQAIVSAIELVPAWPHRMNPVRLTPQDHAVTDSEGNQWMPDNYSIGGQLTKPSSPPLGTREPALYEMERYGHFNYAIPVAGGSYDLALHFAEMYWGPENPGGGGPGSRVFDIFCNGTALVRALDIYGRAGANHVLVLRYHDLQPNAQGKLHLTFAPVKNYANLYAIEVDDATR